MNVSCPICSKSVVKSQINHHMDICLLKANTKEKRQKESEDDLQIMEPQPALNPKQQQHQDVVDKPPLKKRKRSDLLPLAEKARPTDFEDFQGQACMSQTSDLAILVKSGNTPNLILFGPPGCGKTTCARMIGKKAGFYLEFSATFNNVQDVRAGAEKALKHKQFTGRKGILFVDEIHRFTKAQQDMFLQGVERGDYILLAATTENPSFRINNALLSRCRVFVFNKLERDDLRKILKRALLLLQAPKEEDENIVQNEKLDISDDIIDYIADFCDGDARVALNVLEQVYQTAIADHSIPDIDSVQKAFTRTSMLYDRDGEEHYNIISALHKSMRGNDENAALYWLGRMVYGGEDPLYIARRLVRFASEDIGLANNDALPLALSTYQACQVIGMPECDVILAHCVAYLAKSPKSVDVYRAMKKVKATLARETNYPVPLHLRNAPTPLMKDLEYGKGYKYTPNYETAQDAHQEYLPSKLQTRDFFK